MQEVEGVAFSQFTQQCLEEDSGERGADERQVKTEKTLPELHMITAGPVRSRSEGRVNESRISSENGEKAFQEVA